jgi:hypothetical protein
MDSGACLIKMQQTFNNNRYLHQNYGSWSLSLVEISTDQVVKGLRTSASLADYPRDGEPD